MSHTPLHRLSPDAPHITGGRLRKDEHGWCIFNAFCEYFLSFEELKTAPPSGDDRALVRLTGVLDGDTIAVTSLEVIHRPRISAPPDFRESDLDLATALRARHELYRRVHAFFEERDFLEVRTRALLRAPGTDPHLDPVPALFREAPDEGSGPDAYLHTSPELPMKRLLCAGAGPIYQLGRVWRNGEVTTHHNPEFELLEWYRPWEPVDAIIDDVEALVGAVLDSRSDHPITSPIERMTMQEVVAACCGFDILEALDTESLRDEVRRQNLLSHRASEDAPWDELFFSLTVSHIDPFLKKRGAVFVTHWPRPLAVLARGDDDDPRVARRFELYIDGIELANGFGELTDPDEQRMRFVDDNAHRRRLGLAELPLPEGFLQALQWGLPPSSGVALGIDRLLMLATAEAEKFSDVQPFALYRDADGIRWP